MTIPARLYPRLKTRVYRTSHTAEGLASPPIWVWFCAPCAEVVDSCHHRLIHPPGTWAAAMCGAFRHTHAVHRAAAHTTLFGRNRCSASPVTDAQAAGACALLAVRGYPRDVYVHAREILALHRAAPATP